MKISEDLYRSSNNRFNSCCSSAVRLFLISSQAAAVHDGLSVYASSVNFAVSPERRLLKTTKRENTISHSCRHSVYDGRLRIVSVNVFIFVSWKLFSFKRSDTGTCSCGLLCRRSLNVACAVLDTCVIQSLLCNVRKASASRTSLAQSIRMPIPFFISQHFTSVCPSFNPMLGLQNSGLPVDASTHSPLLTQSVLCVKVQVAILPAVENRHLLPRHPTVDRQVPKLEA